MTKLIKFFINNDKLNNILLAIFIILGIVFYVKTPKELFPVFELDYILVTGAYPGTSINTFDKMAVNEIEDNLKGISGIVDFESYITPGNFSIFIKLKEGTDKNKVLNNVKDAISKVVPKLPKDMDEPTANIFDFSFPVLNLSVSSKGLNRKELLEKTQDIEKKLLLVEGVNSVKINGDSDEEIKIVINDKKVSALGLNGDQLVDEISKLSYIFPIGKIESKSKHLLVSTYNGKKSAKDIASTVIKSGDKFVRLGDIATVSIEYADALTMSTLNGKNSLVLTVSKSEDGDIINISKKIKKLIATEFKSRYKGINFKISNDQSVLVKNRLNTVMSNILMGIVLIGIFMWLLINRQVASVVIIGIPTAFIIAMIYLYIAGITINIMSLLGVLLAVGIVVDDAIVVVERIQYYVDRDYKIKDAALKGASDMALPIFVSLLTTLFAFLPILMISGEMGIFLRLIPITVVAILIASYFETFIFLPIHAAHMLKSNMKTKSWVNYENFYRSIISKILKHKKWFLIGFASFCILLIVITKIFTKFQSFPSFDSGKTYVAVKLDPNIKVEGSFKIIKEIEAEILKHRKELFIKTTVATAGFKRNSREGKSGDSYPYVMNIEIEFLKLKPQNFIDKYVNPIFSLEFLNSDSEKGVRTLSTKVLSQKIREMLKPFKTKYKIPYIDVEEDQAGPVSVDVQIGVSDASDKVLVESVGMLKEGLNGIKGIKNVSTNANLGIDEFKIKVNSYGEKLGISEAMIGNALANSYLSREIAYSFNSKDMLSILVESKYKDSIGMLKNFNIHLADDKTVALRDVATFETVKSFEKVTKVVGRKMLYLFVNIDHNKVVSSEVLKKLEPVINKIKAMGVTVSFKGEKESNEQLAVDMLIASSITFMLIVLSLIYLFNSFRCTFIVMAIIPLSIIGSLIGHLIMGINLTIPSVIGILGLAGVIINNGILVVLSLLEYKAKTISEVIEATVPRFRPIVITSITTLLGLSTLVFFASGQAKVLQPLAVSLGFGLLWGTILNLILLPVLFYIFVSNSKIDKTSIYKRVFIYIKERLLKRSN